MSSADATALARGDILAAADQAFAMDDRNFAAFYERTARPLWLYLARTSGDPRLADDLLHEAYYRLLRSEATFESDDHRRHYLFRVGANLVRDDRRRHGRRAAATTPADDALVDRASEDGAARAVARLDLYRALSKLSPRERSLLWLAYVDGQTHEEMAAAHGVKRSSLKMLLHRARRRLLGLLKPREAGGDA
jgi:RNA polymerase sigma-70 factor, ECF subfamily